VNGASAAARAALGRVWFLRGEQPQAVVAVGRRTELAAAAAVTVDAQRVLSFHGLVDRALELALLLWCMPVSSLSSSSRVGRDKTLPHT
jgi:hypothetical protein